MSVRRVKGDASADRMVAVLDGLDGVEGKIGWFETATYATGEPVAYIASIHEFGYAPGGIPARPFMRPAVAEHGQAWVDLLAKGANAALSGSMPARDVLEMVVLRGAADVAKTIEAVSSPALAPATAKRKGFDKPLVDTGQLIQSVTGKVESK